LEPWREINPIPEKRILAQRRKDAKVFGKSILR